MKRFKNILVGVDLSNGDRLVSNDLVVPTQEAITQAVLLAKANAAKLGFYYVLPSHATNLDAKSQVLLEEHHGRRTVEDHAKEVIAEIANNARSQGIEVEGSVGFGTSWIQLIRRVQLGNHDLLVTGTRHCGPVKIALLGSTGIKLLRKCPCPVWITQPQCKMENILVAHDLKPVCDLALELGASIARNHNAKLNVLHVLEYSDEVQWYLGRVPGKNAAMYREEAEAKLKLQLAKLEPSQTAQVSTDKNPQETAVIVSSSNSPGTAIVDFLNHHKIDLLVMGTVARTGVAGLITGNTAEKLLPHISCSVLAIKPEGFRTPVTLE